MKKININKVIRELKLIKRENNMEKILDNRIHTVLSYQNYGIQQAIDLIEKNIYEDDAKLNK
jgi:hypothetical protein